MTTQDVLTALGTVQDAATVLVSVPAAVALVHAYLAGRADAEVTRKRDELTQLKAQPSPELATQQQIIALQDTISELTLTARVNRVRDDLLGAPWILKCLSVGLLLMIAAAGIKLLITGYVALLG